MFYSSKRLFRQLCVALPDQSVILVFKFLFQYPQYFAMIISGFETLQDVIKKNSKNKKNKQVCQMLFKRNLKSVNFFCSSVYKGYYN